MGDPVKLRRRHGTAKRRVSHDRHIDILVLAQPLQNIKPIGEHVKQEHISAKLGCPFRFLFQFKRFAGQVDGVQRPFACLFIHFLERRLARGDPLFKRQQLIVK